MGFIQQILCTARKCGPHALVVQAGSTPRWADTTLGVALPDEIQKEVQADVLTAFLFRTMPSSSQARLAMGQPVEYRTLVSGDEWALRAESSEQGVFVHATPIQSVEESMSYCVRDEDASASQPEPDRVAPGPVPVSAQESSPQGRDEFDQIQFERRSSTDADAQGQAPGFDYEDASARLIEAGVPGHVEDTPFGMASGAISLGRPGNLTPCGRGGVFGTLVLVSSRAVMTATLDHLQDPRIEVRNDSSLFESYPLIDSLRQGCCVSVDVEDPSIWFAWIMRRLEQGCTVVVLCRAHGELGALRVLCGLHPELPCSRWLAEHRRVFLSDLDAVTTYFVSDLWRSAPKTA